MRVFNNAKGRLERCVIRDHRVAGVVAQGGGDPTLAPDNVFARNAAGDMVRHADSASAPSSSSAAPPQPPPSAQSRAGAAATGGGGGPDPVSVEAPSEVPDPLPGLEWVRCTASPYFPPI